jgi:NDP-sugar pyrophosphorylase family protein
VEVGEFCVFEGPLYLGKGVKVGNFVALGSGVFVEAGSVIEAHSQLSKISLGENSLVQTVIKSKITYKL